MTRTEDTNLLATLSKEQLVEFLFLELRNLWTIDGLYFLGIEEADGTEHATSIDAHVWEVMGKIEARKLKQFLHITGDDIPSMMKACSTPPGPSTWRIKRLLWKKTMRWFAMSAAGCRTRGGRKAWGSSVANRCASGS